VPAGFAPQSFTAVSETRWWLLGYAPCSSPPCTSIVRTADGGRRFAAIPAPRTQHVDQLRFADVRSGFAYGPELWVTHDGGAHWRQVVLGGAVTDLAISDGWAYAIVARITGTAPGKLERTPVSSDQWTALPAAGNAYSGLWAQGSEVLLESAPQSQQQLMVSHDRGDSFTTYRVPPSVACQFEAPAPPVLWAHCATGMLSGVWRSSDEGRTFSRAAGAHSWPGPPLPNSAAFGAASPTTAVVGYKQLYRTANGGASWASVATPSAITWWQYLGFTDPTHGVGLAYAGSQTPSHQRLYYTTDAGLSYHLVSIR
jgi:photosystem II stability/assembly factor-like uncharacterized protein